PQCHTAVVPQHVEMNRRGRFPKGVPESRNGSNEAGLRRVVPQGLSNLRDEVDEILFDHERVGPQLLTERGFRQRLRTIGDEDLQELVRLWRERDRMTCTRQLARVRIQ